MMRLRFFLGASALGGAAILAAVACGPGELHKLMEGYQDTNTNPDQSPDDPCKHAFPPARPPEDASVKTDRAGSITLALSEMRIDTAAPGATIAAPAAYDLDKKCTCLPGVVPSCKKAKTDAVCTEDDEHGGDNVIGPLMNTVAGALPIVSSAKLKERIDKGFFSMLINITNWNGTDNDLQVTVAIFMSVGLHGRSDAIVPQFNGADVWDVSPDSVSGGTEQAQATPPVDCGNPKALECVPFALDPNAYITKGKLVANFDRVPFAFGDGLTRISIPLASAMLVGKLDGTAPPYTFEGDLTGRWASHDILEAMAHIAFVDDNNVTTALCNDPSPFGKYQLVYNSICSAVDLAPSRNDDIDGGAPCTSLSQSTHLIAKSAHLGPITATTTATNSDKCVGTFNKTSCE